MGFLTLIVNYVRQLAGLVVPFFAKVGDLRRFTPVVVWTIRIVLIGFIVAALYLLDTRFLHWGGEHGTLVKTSNPFIREYFLPLLGLLLIAIAWLAYWIWFLLRPEEEVSRFPDIDEAWAEALQALNKAGVDARELPLFLVLGRPAGREDPIFRSADLVAAVHQAPSRSKAPLHLYAYRQGNYDSIFVTCAGASLLGKHAAVMAGDEVLTDSQLQLSGQASGDLGMGNFDPYKTVQPEGEVKDILQIIRKARSEGRELTDDEKQKVTQLERKGKPSLLNKAGEMELYTARLLHLCRLIQQERRPYCPLNGIIILLPWAASDSDEEADQTGKLCRVEVDAVRSIFQLHCPIFALICDLQKAPGGQEFLDSFPREQIKNRLGQRFPLAPDLPPQGVLEKIESATNWVNQALLPLYACKFLKLDATVKAGSTTRTNKGLSYFLCALHERSKRLGQLMVRGLTTEEPKLLFGGCYVAATGEDPAREQAFVAGFLRKVIENQSSVSWTDAALAEDAARSRYAVVGYIIMAAVGAVTTLLLVLYASR
jgi:hypothetical protein